MIAFLVEQPTLGGKLEADRENLACIGCDSTKKPGLHSHTSYETCLS
jgi:hypothetical protein